MVWYDVWYGILTGILFFICMVLWYGIYSYIVWNIACYVISHTV